MRTLIGALVGVWVVLTVVAYSFVLPDTRGDENLVLAYLEIGPDDPSPSAALVRGYFEEHRRQTGRDHPSHAAVTAMSAEPRREIVADFSDWFARTQPNPLKDSPRLVWSTDDNPARRTQCQLFRVWHLRKYGTPIDLATDPSNRDTTKTIVQCVAGAGPDIIETYGPAQLSQFVEAGVALDITDLANAKGFGEAEVFPAAVSSMSSGGRQYAFPCNVGYTVLFYHRDMFEAAGIKPPPASGGWTLSEAIVAAKAFSGATTDGGRRRVGIMGLGAWGMALADGATFFNDNGTASLYNSPNAVAALQSYLDLMYRDRVMPTPADLASMASSGGANMNMGAEAASASALFTAKACAMINDGRWSYVTFAKRQLDRVIAPAMRRRIAARSVNVALDAEDDESSTNPWVLPDRERTLLQSALDSLLSDVLVPITDEQYALLESCLSDDDRKNLLQLGVAHVPTTGGTPYYEAGARVAIVNRASPRAELATRFIEFLAGDEYNNQINFTFDSISGTPKIIQRNGISGPPRALPGLEAFDSPVFVEAMDKYAHPWELSPFIGRNRLGQLVGPILEELTNNMIGAAEAARLVEDRINAQIAANLKRDSALRAEWEKRTGKTFDPQRSLREQVEDASPQRHRDTEEGAGSGKDKEKGHANSKDQLPALPPPRITIPASSSLCLCVSVVNELPGAEA